jgi:dipicolinate synthase subunit A
MPDKQILIYLSDTARMIFAAKGDGLMLTGIHLTFIGGDARQIEVIKKCSELDATISLIGFNQLQSEYSGATKVLDPADAMKKTDALILPIVGIGDDGRVECLFSDNKTMLTAKHVQLMPKHAVIYTGMANERLLEMANEANIKLVQLLERDDVAIYNAIPTVEGALMMAIQHTDITIHDAHIMVLGFGRVGMSLARVLHGLGAHVKVGARRPEHMARIYEMGMRPFHISNLKNEAQDTDIIYNTIPLQVVNADVIVKLPFHALIIDLASKPGGTDFRFAEKRGIKALLAPGLPGIVAPKTAGKILANVITQLIMEDKTNSEATS